MRTVVLLCSALLCGAALTAFLLHETGRPGAGPSSLPSTSAGGAHDAAAQPADEPELVHASNPVDASPSQGRLPAQPTDGAAPARAADALLASGRVLDSAGQPVPGARVTAHIVTGSDILLTTAVGEAVVTRADGQFSLTEKERPHPVTRFYLDVTRDGFMPAKETLVVRGDRALEIVLHRPGILQGRWLRSPEVPADIVRLRVENEGGQVLQDSALSDPSDPRISLTEKEQGAGSFVLRSLIPGRYTVSFAIQSSLAVEASHPLARVDDVVVREGETTLDARLDPVDLRGSTRAFVLDIRGPDESRPPVVRLKSRSGASDYWVDCEPVRLADGRLVLFTTEPALDLLLAVDGYRDEVIEEVRSNRTVLLQRGIDARVTIDDMPALPSDFTLYVELVPRDDAAYESVTERSIVSPDGSARFALPRAGPYAASLVLTHPEEGDAGDLELALSDEIEFEVLEQEPTQEFHWPGVDGSIFEALQGAQHMR